MSKSAAELVDLIVENKAKKEQRSFDRLREKVVTATSQMVTDLSLSTEVELEDEDLLSLSRVTEALRDLGYKFRFIEIQNSNGETVKHKLLISVNHLI